VELAGIVGDERPRVCDLAAFGIDDPEPAALFDADGAALARGDMDGLGDARIIGGTSVSHLGGA
jgi:hypothetical protein